MRDHLIIFINGRRCEVRGAGAFQPLSSYLRYELGLTGTKVVCAEGDCGSCSVLLGRVCGDRIAYQPITSCIQFLYQLDGMHIVTIEGLKYDGKLNPVQEAMVRCHGAQCGYCTPGFVVATCGMFNERKHLDETALRAGLIGNLCRCTGYEPILKVAMEVARQELRHLDELYPPAGIIDAMRSAHAEPVLIESADRKFYKPVTVADACAFKALHPNCAPIAGGTDLGVQINKGTRDPRVILSLLGLSELRAIALENNTLVAGALATLTDLERRTEELCPEFARMLFRHGSPLIRNAGTLAGNIANGSPIGDTMPALFVLNGEVELTGRNGARRVNTNEFYTGYRKTVAQPDELITQVVIPLPEQADEFRLYKVSKRHDLDISTFTAALWMRRSNGVIEDIRIAYGGVGPVILRLPRTEAALKGKPFTADEIENVVTLAQEEITPISDVRGSKDYRYKLAANVLRKFYADTSGTETYLRVTPYATRGAFAVGAKAGEGDGKAR